MVTWQARARDFEPRLQTCRSWTLMTPSTASMPERISSSETPRGVPSSRIFRVSRTMPEAGPEDQRGNEQRENGVDPVLAGEQDARAAGDDSGGGERVAGHVQKGRAQVHVAGHAPQQRGNHAVHHHAGRGHEDHQPGLHRHRCESRWTASMAIHSEMTMSVAGVEKGGQHAGALVAKGLGMAGRAGLEVDGGKAEQQGEEIGDVVAGLGQQRQRVGAQAGHKGDRHIGERGRQRDAQYGLGSICAGRRGRRVEMHREKYTGDGYWSPTRLQVLVSRGRGAGYPDGSYRSARGPRRGSTGSPTRSPDHSSATTMLFCGLPGW